MSNRAIRQAIQSLRERIAEHQAKIDHEQGKPSPNEGLIAHWETEIQVFTFRLRRLEDRLTQRRRRA